MRLNVLIAVSVVTAIFQIHVLSRLLFDQQSEVGSHHVHTSLYTQLLTHEGRFQQGSLPVVGLEQFCNDLLQVPHLLHGLHFKRHWVQVGACTVFQSLLPVVVFQCFCHVKRTLSTRMDDVIERTTGKISQNGMPRIGFILHAVDGEEGWMMAIFRKTCRQ